MVMDIDKTEVFIRNGKPFFDSPVFSNIQPIDLSGGVKSLILLYKSEELKEYFFKSSLFGENCFPWVFQIAKKKDVKLYSCSFFPLPDNNYNYGYGDRLVQEYGDYDYTALNLDNNEIVSGFIPIVDMLAFGEAGKYR